MRYLRLCVFPALSELVAESGIDARHGVTAVVPATSRFGTQDAPDTICYTFHQLGSSKRKTL